MSFRSAYELLDVLEARVVALEGIHLNCPEVRRILAALNRVTGRVRAGRPPPTAPLVVGDVDALVRGIWLAMHDRHWLKGMDASYLNRLETHVRAIVARHVSQPALTEGEIGNLTTAANLLYPKNSELARVVRLARDRLTGGAS